jgi:hypothetical protein
MLQAKTTEESPKKTIRNVNYAVTTVQKTDMPKGGKGRTWYRYVIEGGYAPITGSRPGTQKQIKEYASLLAEELNARSGVGAPSSWAPRQKK